jgi:TatD DNase family protein
MHPFFDTHCHLDVERFDADRARVFERAHAAGVTRILNPAFSIGSSRSALAVAEAHEGMVAAVGVHPNDTAQFGDAELDTLRELAAHPKCVAIGEIGLDYHWKTVDPAIQKQAFVRQLNLARELDLPVIIHCREAEEDTLEILTHEFSGRPLVLHSFAGTVQHAQRALDCGFYIGISGPVTYPNAAQTREVVRYLPLDRLVIETDAPYLSPQRHRGKRNEPAYVRLVAEKIADVRDMLLDDIARVTTENGMRLFRVGSVSCG